MPELPEVEALRRYLEYKLSRRSVASVQVVAFSALKTFKVPLEALVGLEISGVQRHGKFLDVDAQGTHLVFHLARAGWLSWRQTVPLKPVRPGRGPLALRVRLDDESGFDLTEAGTQRKLAIHVIEDPAEVPGIARLGPDPLSDAFTAGLFHQILSDAGRSQLKGLLRDQSTIAGIGNAYSDEILHAARLSPFKPANGLNEAEEAALLQAISDQLVGAIDRAGGLAANDLKDNKRSNMAVHGRTGERCPVCGDVIAEVSFADSTLQYCPSCQTGGTKLADRRMSKLLK